MELGEPWPEEEQWHAGQRNQCPLGMWGGRGGWTLHHLDRKQRAIIVSVRRDDRNVADGAIVILKVRHFSAAVKTRPNKCVFKFHFGNDQRRQGQGEPCLKFTIHLIVFKTQVSGDFQDSKIRCLSINFHFKVKLVFFSWVTDVTKYNRKKKCLCIISKLMATPTGMCF